MVKRIEPSDARITIETNLETRQKLRVLASLEAMSMKEWLTWMVKTAYASKVRAKK